jgi:hypothetical protein
VYPHAQLGFVVVCVCVCVCVCVGVCVGVVPRFELRAWNLQAGMLSLEPYSQPFLL